MRIKKALQLSFGMLVHSKLRSYLTIIGIVIGIAAVVSIVSISIGAQQQIQNGLGNIGANILTVTPGFSRAGGGVGFVRFRDSGGGGTQFFSDNTASSTTQKNLTINDINVIKGVPNVKYVMGQISSRETFQYLTKSTSVQITGVDTTVWSEITTETLSSGRFLTSSDTDSVVIGGNLATSTFSNIPLNSRVTIDGQNFRVVGILTGGNGVYMPIESARNLFDKGGDDYDSISVEISDISLANQTVTDITQRLMLERGILQSSQQDFTVTNPAEIQATIQSTLGTTSLFLAAIAAISLIVGAIGITNTMFTSVLEKTRDIGIMKAIGATNKDILMIFLLDAGMIGLVGGLGGIILGVIGSGFIGSLASTSGGGLSRAFSTTAVTPALLIGALVFSIIIGMIAGAVPAYRASRLKPADSLRYE